jgi:short-subunit dehydrogenase
VDAFRDRVVIVTGASEGIGRALALELARAGAKLVLAARDAGRLESAAAECRAAGADAAVVPTDVADEQACRALVDAAVARHGRLDVLVNNAGITMWSRFEELASLDVFEHLMRVNFLGAVYLTRYALPHLRAMRGQVVAIASLAGLTGVPERTAYAASKHALIGFCESLRIELAGSGVDVTIVAPDFVVTEIHRRALGPDGRPLGVTPMREQKLMTAEECARLALAAIARRDRLCITSLRGKLGRWIKLVAPGVIDRIAARAIARRH